MVVAVLTNGCRRVTRVVAVLARVVAVLTRVVVVFTQVVAVLACRRFCCRRYDRYPVTLPLTFSQNIFEQNVSVQLKLLQFLLLRNKARNAGRSGKNAGIKPKCGTVDTYAKTLWHCLAGSAFGLCGFGEVCRARLPRVKILVKTGDGVSACPTVCDGTMARLRVYSLKHNCRMTHGNVCWIIHYI